MFGFGKKNKQQQPPRRTRTASAVRFDSNDSYREDFWDYESKGITPSRFGDTRPIYTPETEIQDYDLLNNLYHKSGIAHKVVTKPAEDATRNGWRIVIPDDPNKQAVYQKALDDLDLKRVMTQELIYQRLHGDGYVDIGLDEQKTKPDLSVPIDVNAINNVVFVHAFGQTHVHHIEVSNDPTSNDYMQETSLTVNQTKGGETVDKYGNSTYKPVKVYPVVIDKSRYFHISLDKLEDDDTGVSIITRCYDQIKTLDTALYSVGKIIYAYDINVLYDDGTVNLNDPESVEQADAQDRAVRQGMGTDSVLNLHNGQKFERVSTNVSGLEQLLTFAWQNLAAASNIPKSVLLGEQAGTLAGATTDVANYYDGVKAIQEELLRPQLERIIQLLMWSTDVGDGSEDPDSIKWKLVFNPLWSADDKTQSETNLNNTNAEVAKVNAGIEDPDTANQNLAGQNNNSVQPTEMATDSSDDTDNISLKDAQQLMNRLQGIINGKKKT